MSVIYYKKWRIQFENDLPVLPRHIEQAKAIVDAGLSFPAPWITDLEEPLDKTDDGQDDPLGQVATFTEIPLG